MNVSMREGLMLVELVAVKDSTTKGVQANKWDVLQEKNVLQEEKRGWADLL
jgi:hypothetical protein